MDLADVLEQTEKRLSSASAVRAMPEGQSLKVNSTYIENRTIYIHAPLRLIASASHYHSRACELAATFSTRRAGRNRDMQR